MDRTGVAFERQHWIKRAFAKMERDKPWLAIIMTDELIMKEMIEKYCGKTSSSPAIQIFPTYRDFG